MPRNPRPVALAFLLASSSACLEHLEPPPVAPDDYCPQIVEALCADGWATSSEEHDTEAGCRRNVRQACDCQVTTPLEDPSNRFDPAAADFCLGMAQERRWMGWPPNCPKIVVGPGGECLAGDRLLCSVDPMSFDARPSSGGAAPTGPQCDFRTEVYAPSLGQPSTPAGLGGACAPHPDDGEACAPLVAQLGFGGRSCAIGSYCEPGTELFVGECAPRRPPGDPCSASPQCLDGRCADGRCTRDPPAPTAQCRLWPFAGLGELGGLGDLANLGDLAGLGDAPNPPDPPDPPPAGGAQSPRRGAQR